MCEDTFSFSVDARLVTQLGEQLVPSDVTALAELVKNAYDADATTVLIDYRPDDDPPCFIIEDDGHGMALEDVRQGWMTIGTAVKERMKISPLFKRARTGRKGIGRFAGQRLGKELILWSTVKGEDAATEVDFDWEVFKPGRSLEDIVQARRSIPAAKKEHGTRLTIKGLLRKWSSDDLKEVLEKLIRLQAPSTMKARKGEKKPTDPGFSVLVSINGASVQEDLDEVDLLRDESTFTIIGKVDKTGKGTYEFRFHRPKGKIIRESFPHALKTGPLEFNLDVFVFRKESLERLSIRRAADLGKRYGGCQIWRDKFRVYPYGEPDDDWLGIDAHVASRRPPLNMPRNVQVLGGVKITAKNNPDLVDLLTRRGLLDNQAFKDLKEFMFEGIKLGANEHAALAGKRSRGGTAKSKPSEATLKEVERARAEREVRRQEKADAWRKATAEGVIEERLSKEWEKEAEAEEKSQRQHEEQLIQKVEEAERELLDENAMLRVLASLGTGLAAFSHELRMVGSSVSFATQEIEKLASSYPGNAAEEIEIQTSCLRDGIEDMAAYRRYIDDFIQTSSRRKRQPIELKPFIMNHLQTFGSFLDARSIVPRSDIPRGIFTVSMHRAELNSVLFNLITNAVKAMLVPGVSDRRILFKGFTDGNEACLVVADTGCGIPRSIADRIFDPFISRTHTQDDEALGQGTGLGLTIVKDIIASYGGVVEVVKPPSGFHTAFEVRIAAKE